MVLEMLLVATPAELRLVWICLHNHSSRAVQSCADVLSGLCMRLALRFLVEKCYLDLKNEQCWGKYRKGYVEKADSKCLGAPFAHM